ncbi:site-2 protease family protein [Altererythrobacter aquiaggeris]|uniref:site-2 protease family protein n=1 Tax=Aestuarierythrobacter aquiaggeris TaxID=1898396 RepID=UPI003018A2FC
MTETLMLAAILIPVLVIAIVFHEVAHGWTALALGDPTAKERNRLSLNPIRHVDPIGTVVLPGFLALVGAPVFGWAKPVPVIKERLHNPRFGMMAVAFAGPLTNFILAAIGAVVLGVLMGNVTQQPEGGMAIVVEGLQYFLAINLFLALFNLLPIPPFDGSHIIEGLLPDRAAAVYDKIRPLGFPLLFILLIGIPYLLPEANIIENVVLPPVEWALGHYYSLATWVAQMF